MLCILRTGVGYMLLTPQSLAYKEEINRFGIENLLELTETVILDYHQF